MQVKGKDMSEGVYSMFLIERLVVNCLYVGGEKSICFLTAVTPGPRGDRLELADTRTERCQIQPRKQRLPLLLHTLEADAYACTLFTYMHAEQVSRDSFNVRVKADQSIHPLFVEK